MQCDVCGTVVEAHHKFCMECGARLATTPAVDGGPVAPLPSRGHPMFDPTTGQLLAVPPSGPDPDPHERHADPGTAGHPSAVGHPGTAGYPDDHSAASYPGAVNRGHGTDGAGPRGFDPATAEPDADPDAGGYPDDHSVASYPGAVDRGHGTDGAGPRGFDPATAEPDADPDAAGLVRDDDVTSVVQALGPPVTTFAPPDPTPGRGLPWSTVLDPPTPPPSPPDSPGPPPPLAGVTPAPFEAGGYPAWTTGPVATGSFEDGRYYEPTRAQYLPERFAAAPSGRGVEPYTPTSHVPVAYAPWETDATGEVPPPPPREFRVKPLAVLAVLAVVATGVAMVGEIVVIAPPGGPNGGPWKINDFGTNLTVAGIVTALALLAGAVAWCAGHRWGAGLTGGAGAGLAGWAVLPLGAAETTLTTTRLAGPAEMSRQVGWWALVGAGGLGLLVLLVSLARAGHDRRAGLDPWVAAVGAAAAITAALGPLIPLNGAGLELNWSSPTGVDHPTIYFVARFAHLGLLLACGVVGFLLVRRYGLGLVFGGFAGSAWLVLTAAMARTDKPIGPAYYNPGAVPSGGPPWTLSPTQLAPLTAAGDLKPHVVTIAGFALVGFFALVATVMALLDSD